MFKVNDRIKVLPTGTTKVIGIVGLEGIVLHAAEDAVHPYYIQLDDGRSFFVDERELEAVEEDHSGDYPHNV